MTPETVLTELTRLGIHARPANGGEIVLQGDTDGLMPELVAAIRAIKPQLWRVLRHRCVCTASRMCLKHYLASQPQEAVTQ